MPLDPHETVLVALDVDGTLVARGRGCSERNVAAIREARARGVEILLVTARPARTLVPFARTIGITEGVAICSLGASTCDIASGALRDTRPMTVATGREIVARVRAVDPGIVFGWDTPDALWYEDGYPPMRGSEHGFRRGRALDDMVAPVLHLFARHLDGVHDWGGRAAEAASGIAQAEVWTGVLVDFTAPGVTKLAALRRHCEARGIAASRVVAMGDMPADAPMLRWAGRGVAVADAHPEAIAAADQVVGACDADGVAEALEAL